MRNAKKKQNKKQAVWGERSAFGAVGGEVNTFSSPLSFPFSAAHTMMGEFNPSRIQLATNSWCVTAFFFTVTKKLQPTSVPAVFHVSRFSNNALSREEKLFQAQP